MDRAQLINKWRKTSGLQPLAGLVFGAFLNISLMSNLYAGDPSSYPFEKYNSVTQCQAALPEHIDEDSYYYKNYDEFFPVYLVEDGGDNVSIYNIACVYDYDDSATVGKNSAYSVGQNTFNLDCDDNPEYWNIYYDGSNTHDSNDDGVINDYYNFRCPLEEPIPNDWIFYMVWCDFIYCGEDIELDLEYLACEGENMYMGENGITCYNCTSPDKEVCIFMYQTNDKEVLDLEFQTNETNILLSNIDNSINNLDSISSGGDDSRELSDINGSIGIGNGYLSFIDESAKSIDDSAQSIDNKMSDVNDSINSSNSKLDSVNTELDSIDDNLVSNTNAIGNLDSNNQSGFSDVNLSLGTLATLGNLTNEKTDITNDLLQGIYDNTVPEDDSEGAIQASFSNFKFSPTNITGGSSSCDLTYRFDLSVMGLGSPVLDLCSFFTTDLVSDIAVLMALLYAVIAFRIVFSA